MEGKPFTHLHTHSHYSLLDGLSKIPELVKAAKADGMQAIALTDHGNLYGAIEFYQECKKKELKPIIGVEAYVAPRSRFDKDPGIDNRRYHLTLLAENMAGYKNIIKLVSLSYTEGFYYKPRMDKEILRTYSEGIICLTGCPGGELAQMLLQKNLPKAKEVLEEWIDIFGKENLYIEVMNHAEIEGYQDVIQHLIDLSKEYHVPLVGTWDAHYLHVSDAEAQDTLVAINTGSDISNQKMSMKNGNYSFITSGQAYEFFKNIPGAYDNTAVIAERCNLELTLGKFFFPEFILPPGTNADEVLRETAYAGIKTRGIEMDENVKSRLDYELEVIKTKGYSSYFLIMHDLMRHARENGILTNTRGSAAGSFVSYVCGITNVDPILYKLPFERFLNPFRPSAPDIDLDIADDRRDELIEYARQKYGAEKVAQIGTFGTMAARGAVRDVARALGYPYTTGDRISKMIPMGSQGFPMTLDHALEIVPELKEAYDNERDVKTIIDLAKKIEGSARHISVHAAGVVIAPGPLTDFTPVQFDPKGGKLITQYDMYSVGEDGVGLTKFDFLGIRNLAFLASSIELLEKIAGIKIDIDTMPVDDKKTFEMLARGETEGLFQLNGSGMTQALKKLKPTTIHDINVMVALYRPGPMQTIDEYIARKNGEKPVIFYHPKMKDYLLTTFGLLVYQDDLLFTAIELAGYDWGEVDKFRKAVGKKIPEEMAKQHVKFVEGCQKCSGLTPQQAEKIWTLFEPFQGYGFNKAHAASYGKVAYQTAYMKANYPVYYMCAMLTAESGDIETIGIYINECRRMGLNILPPSINESFHAFTIAKEEGVPLDKSKTIRFGLYTIKNLGGDIADAIISERKKGGAFSSIDDFLNRMTHKNLNKKSMEALIKSGAFDELGERNQLLLNMEALLEYNREYAKKSDTQTSLFSIGLAQHQLKLTETEPANLTEKLNWEKELLGLYISGHPLDNFTKRLEGKNTIEEIKKSKKKTSIVQLGVITEEVRKVQTKTGEFMAFLKLSDKTGSIEAVIFPKNFREFIKIVESSPTLGIAGRTTVRNDEKSIVIEKVITLV
ncbi:MAG: DNA polymerase III subunit alpha [Minisyncoccia bacterium]